jgi:nitrite reductase (NADH) large subunit
MRVVVIGAGPAGTRCAERLAEAGMRVTLAGGEPGLPYNRVALSQYLSAELEEHALVTHAADRLAVLRIVHLPGCRALAIDRAAREVRMQDGAVLEYDRLVLALGAQPVRLSLPGADLPGVVTYRTLDDVQQMLRAAEAGGNAVVIGGGLLGLEAAAGLARRGMRVTVVHAVDRLMERQLDAGAADMLRARLDRMGVGAALSASTAAILGEGRVRGVALADGRTLPADLVVMAVGIRPEVALARTAGLAVGRGILVDDLMRTSDPAILAVGECAEHAGQCCGLVAPALAQAETAVHGILGGDTAYAAPVDAAALKVAGAPVWSAGSIDAEDSIVLADVEAGEYRRLLLRDDRLVGAVLYGEVGDAPWYLGLMRGGLPLGALRVALPFGPAFVPAGMEIGR